MALTVLAVLFVGVLASATTAGEAKTLARPSADLRLRFTDHPDPVRVDQDVAYRIVVRNAGPSTATRLTLVIALTPGPREYARSPGGSCSPYPGGGGYVCHRARLAAGARWRLAFDASVPVAQTVRAKARVRSAVRDPHRRNNSAIVTTRVVAGSGAAAARSHTSV